MIVPMVCFTCGRPIAHLYEQYTEIVAKYTSTKTNYHLPDDPRGSTTPEYLALRDLRIGRECCRRMYVCQHDMYEFVN